MAAPGSNFAYYKAQIAALPPSPDRSELLGGEFLLHEGVVDVHYAPFDGINRAARVVIVGITPGWTQMQQAFETARAALVRGDNDEEVLRLVKRDASFKGMRSTLVRYLDGVCVAETLGIASTAELFDSRRDLLHTTSILRHPVFLDGKNYSGAGHPIAEVPFLNDMVEHFFVPEIDEIPGALVVPLGKKVDEAVASLVSAGRIDGARVLTGFPHPSGANAQGPEQFRLNQAALAEKVKAWAEGATRPRPPVPRREPPSPPSVESVPPANPRRVRTRASGRHKGMYRIPGGQHEFLDGLLRILQHIEADSHTDLQAWIAKEFGSSPATARSVVSFLDKAGLIGTAATSEYLRTRDPVLIVDSLADNFLFIAEVVEMCRAGASMEDVRCAGNATGDFAWEQKNQARLRLEWLEECGMVRNEGGTYRATPAGLAWLESR